MINFNNVNLKFNNVTVLEGFNEEFVSGKINCILGPSGCGKTSLLNILAGLLREQSGQITKPARVSYVFQEEALIPQKTARQNLQLVLKSVYKNKAELDTIITKFLKMAGIENAASLYPHEMSGGMRQRLALIRAFAYPSDILLMDEPFKALDFSLKNSIISSFLQLYNQDRRTTIFVTHDVDEALLTGDFIYVYSDKPMRLLGKFEVEGEKVGRKIYDGGISKVKGEIYREIEKWGV